MIRMKYKFGTVNSSDGRMCVGKQVRKELKMKTDDEKKWLFSGSRKNEQRKRRVMLTLLESTPKRPILNDSVLVFRSIDASIYLAIVLQF